MAYYERDDRDRGDYDDDDEDQNGRGYSNDDGYSERRDEDRYVERDLPQQRYRNEYDQSRGYEEPRGYDQGYQQAPPRREYDQGYQQPPQRRPAPPQQGSRKKSLLIGINYIGSQHQLQGCHQDVSNMQQFLGSMGYSSDHGSQVIMRDDASTDPRGPMYPLGHNMLAAMQWLISEPGTTNFLHYSGHGGQVPDDGTNRTSGFDDTIVPVDFESKGQISSGVLHKALVTRLPPNSTLFVVLDCCHSGSAIELPYVYRSDEDGNVSMLDNVQTGMRLISSASHLVQGGFSMQSVGEAETLLAGATSFFRGLSHKGAAQADQYGLSESDTADEYQEEGEGARNVWMYSGCKDDQTSADADIAGSHVGAMSWAFLESMRRYGPQQSYIQVLQNTRQILKGRYQQVPQLSVGFEQDLNKPIWV